MLSSRQHAEISLPAILSRGFFLIAFIFPTAPFGSAATPGVARIDEFCGRAGAFEDVFPGLFTNQNVRLEEEGLFSAYLPASCVIVLSKCSAHLLQKFNTWRRLSKFHPCTAIPASLL